MHVQMSVTTNDKGVFDAQTVSAEGGMCMRGAGRAGRCVCVCVCGGGGGVARGVGGMSIGCARECAGN